MAADIPTAVEASVGGHKRGQLKSSPATAPKQFLARTAHQLATCGHGWWELAPIPTTYAAQRRMCTLPHHPKNAHEIHKRAVCEMLTSTTMEGEFDRRGIPQLRTSVDTARTPRPPHRQTPHRHRNGGSPPRGAPTEADDFHQR
jgi:hypothetical protein